MSKLIITLGDITHMDVDAIVNAANTSLLGGGGVDGAIHRGAGPELVEECRSLGGCATGEAKMTRGYKLKVQYIIHTVGPIWSGGNNHEAQKLKSCYNNSLKLASQHQLKTIAFPSISTGAYCFPLKEAAHIAVQTITEFLETSEGQKFQTIFLVCFSEKDFKVYQETQKQIQLK